MTPHQAAVMQVYFLEKPVAGLTSGPPGWQYCSHGSGHPDRYEDAKGEWVVQRHVSFVDCPGHDILMATMLNGMFPY